MTAAMGMKTISRRDMFGGARGLAGAIALGLPLGEHANAAQAGTTPQGGARGKIVVAGAHPDDPESGCGGAIARYTDLGHEVVIIYLTRGEAGIEGKTHQEAAAIRTAEATKACEILKARPVFAGQIDGSTEISTARYEDFGRLVEAEKPSLVFTHWPLDSHRDHRATSLLVYDVWLKAGRKYPLFYFEVESGSQTSHFWPTHYVDITATEARKRAACYAHASQQPEDFYGREHDQMNRFRGVECGRKYAEAFVRHVQSPDDLILSAL
jgi:N-acetylglucosamine malate deacetylase 1